MSILKVTNLSKTYFPKKEGVSYQALKNVNLTVEKGEFTAIMDPLEAEKQLYLIFWQPLMSHHQEKS